MFFFPFLLKVKFIYLFICLLSFTFVSLCLPLFNFIYLCRLTSPLSLPFPPPSLIYFFHVLYTEKRDRNRAASARFRKKKKLELELAEKKAAQFSAKYNELSQCVNYLKSYKEELLKSLVSLVGEEAANHPFVEELSGSIAQSFPKTTA